MNRALRVALAAMMFSLAAVAASAQINWSVTKDCSASAGILTGVYFTESVTVDRSVLRVGDTATGSFSNNAVAACKNACTPETCGPDGAPTFYDQGGLLVGGTAGMPNQSAVVNATTCDWECVNRNRIRHLRRPCFSPRPSGQFWNFSIYIAFSQR